jgi:hypothetical protein
MSETIALDAHSSADVATANASRFLQQLCKHFQHKRPVTFDAQTGHIVFSSGECRLEAGESALKIALAAPDAEHLLQLRDVVARHLLRFAFREEMQIAWRDA